MKPRLDDYFAPVGKLTMAAALLEEVTLRSIALLSEEPFDETRFKNLTKGLEQTLTMLADLVRQRVSAANQQSVIDLIEKARRLKDKRNESVHGVWGEMQDADTGEFSHVARSRYEKDRATRSTKWILKVPTVDELNTLATDLHAVAHTLNDRLAHLFDMDDDVQSWRRTRNF
jgi:hypothetical protein